MWSMLPFTVRMTVCSYLSPSSILQLSAVDKRTHRLFTSRDFDQTYWKYVALGRTGSFSDILKPEQHVRLAGDPLMIADASNDFHLSVCTISNNTELEEMGIISCTESCHWRFTFIEKTAIPASLHSALFFIKYPIVSDLLLDY